MKEKKETSLKTKKKPMEFMRTIALGVVTIQLVATSGCVNPDGTVNNTGTGALIGGTKFSSGMSAVGQ